MVKKELVKDHGGDDDHRFEVWSSWEKPSTLTLYLDGNKISIGLALLAHISYDFTIEIGTDLGTEL